jgi:hypothetical protein
MMVFIWTQVFCKNNLYVYFFFNEEMWPASFPQQYRLISISIPWCATPMFTLIWPDMEWTIRHNMNIYIIIHRLNSLVLTKALQLIENNIKYLNMTLMSVCQHTIYSLPTETCHYIISSNEAIKSLWAFMSILLAIWK